MKENKTILKVLFVGNSATFYNTLPETLEKLATTAGYAISVYLGNYGVKSTDVNLSGDYYMAELLELADMLRNNHVRQTPEEVVYPVYVIDALIRSMESGGAETTPAL